MSIEEYLKEVKKRVHKKAICEARASKGTGKRNKTDLVCFVGIPPTISFMTINNN